MRDGRGRLSSWKGKVKGGDRGTLDLVEAV